jgi:hypothetical protein
MVGTAPIRTGSLPPPIKRGSVAEAPMRKRGDAIMPGATVTARIGRAGIAAVAPALLCLVAPLSFADQASDASQTERPETVLAGQVRQQGHICDKALEAHRDAALSRPDVTAWILRCSNATYSIRLRPGMAARIDRISGEP